MSLLERIHEADPAPVAVALATHFTEAGDWARAIRYRVVLDIPLGLALSAVLLPVTVRHLFRYRGALLLAVGAVLAAISGLVITELRSATEFVMSSVITTAAPSLSSGSAARSVAKP